MANKEEVLKNLNRWYINFNYKRELENFRKRHSLDNPIVKRVQLEVTQKCNFNCLMCPRNLVDTSRDMSFEEFKIIVNKLPQSVETIIFHGLGENALHPNFYDMLFYLKEKDYIIEHFSNLSVLKKDALDFIDILYISLDDVDPSSLKKLRGNINPSLTFEKLFLFREETKKRNKPLNISISLSYINYKHLKEIYDFLDKFNIDLVQIQPITNNFPYNSKEFWTFEKFIEKNFEKVDWKRVAEIYLENDYNFNLLIWYPRKYMKGLCVWGFDHVYINKDGDIISCCRKVVRTIKFGNLLEKSFEEIFYSTKYNAFRKAHLEGKKLGFCDYCTQGWPLKYVKKS